MRLQFQAGSATRTVPVAQQVKIREQARRWKAAEVKGAEICKKEASFGVKEILQKLQTGELERSDRDITLEWYKKLVYWDEYLRSIKMKDSLIDIK